MPQEVSQPGRARCNAGQCSIHIMPRLRRGGALIASAIIDSDFFADQILTPNPQNSLARISVCNQASNGNSYLVGAKTIFFQSGPSLAGEKQGSGLKHLSTNDNFKPELKLDRSLERSVLEDPVKTCTRKLRTLNGALPTPIDDAPLMLQLE